MVGASFFQSQVETSQTALETQKPKFQNQVPAPESKVLNFVSFLCVTIVRSIQLNSAEILFSAEKQIGTLIFEF